MIEFKVLTGVLEADTEVITFTNDNINNDSVIEVYTDDFNVYPNNIEQSGNTVSITFDKQATNTNIKLVINNITDVLKTPIDKLNDLVDVTSSLLEDGYILVWDSALSKWIPEELPEPPTPEHIDIIDNLDSTRTDAALSANQGRELNEELQMVFQSVSNGKELIAGAITDKGVQTSASDTFSTMANNIEQIQGGEPSELISNRFGSSKSYTIPRNFKTGYFYVVSGSSSYVWLRLNGANQSPIDSENQSYVYTRVYKINNLKAGDVITTGGYVSSRYFLYNGE